MKTRQIVPLSLRKAQQQLKKAQLRLKSLVARLIKRQAILTATEMHHYRIFDNLLEGCQVLAFDWCYLYVNDAAARQHRCTKEELYGHTMIERYPGIEKTEAFAVLQHCMQARMAETIEHEFTYPDGTSAWFELKIQPVPEGSLLLSLDITTRKRAEDAMRQSAEQRLQRYNHRLPRLNQNDFLMRNAGSIQDVMTSSLKEVRAFFTCQQACVILFDFTTKSALIFACNTATPSGIRQGDCYPVILGFWEEFGVRKVSTIHDLQALVEPNPFYAQVQQDGMRSSLRALLMLQGRPMGVLILNVNSANYFTVEQQESVTQIADQLAIAIHQMRLFEEMGRHKLQLVQTNIVLKQQEVERQQRMMAEILRDNLVALITALQIEVIIQQILSDSGRVIQSEAGAILLFEEGQGRLAYARGHSPETKAFFKDKRITLDGTGLGCNADPHLRVFTGMALPNWQAFPVTEWIRSSIGVPIVLRGETIGLLVADSAIPNRFQQKDVENLEEFAHYAALALENAYHAGHLAQRVTERTTELQAAKERLEVILDNSTDGALLVHADLTIEQTNAAFNRLFACSTDAYVNHSLMALFQAATALQMMKTIQAGTIRGRIENIEVQACRADGTLFDAEISIGFIKGGGFVCTIRDITERQAVQQALLESEARYRLLAENISDVVVRTNPASEYLYVSPSSQTIMGYEPAELVGQSALQYIHPDDMPVMEAAMIAATRRNYPDVTTVARVRHKEGHYVWLETMTRTIRAEKTGAIEGFVSSSRDISDRKGAEAALKDNEEKYRYLVESMGGGLYVYDVDNKITYVNDRACEMLGYTREEVIGTRPIDYADKNLVEKVMEHRKRRRQLESSSYELPARRKDGALLHLLVTASPLLDKNDQYNGGVVVITDITVQKQAEEHLRAALVKEQELGELKSRFISMASHEFRTPLATILAMTETLSAYRHRLPDNQIDQRLDRIKEQVGYLKDTMEDVLLLAQMQARRVKFNPVPIDLDALCRTVLDEFTSHQHDNHPVAYHCAAGDHTVLIDPKLMRQILGNLVSNASKYSPASKPIRVSLRFNVESITLQVSDEGIGIPAADKPYLFEPFHRAANVGTISGTGLGLVITKAAVELHGGSITVESQLDQGTTITVHLPLAKSTPLCA